MNRGDGEDGAVHVACRGAYIKQQLIVFQRDEFHASRNWGIVHQKHRCQDLSFALPSPLMIRLTLA